MIVEQDCEPFEKPVGHKSYQFAGFTMQGDVASGEKP